VPQRLDERPLLDDRPRLAEAVAVVGTHLGPLRHPAVQFGLDQRRDVDAVHDDVPQFATDLDVDEFDAAHPATGERCAADLRPAQVTGLRPDPDRGTGSWRAR
jgi:hypothetical protein